MDHPVADSEERQALVCGVALKITTPKVDARNVIGVLKNTAPPLG